MKIGIQILAYNCATTFEKLIQPWVKLKEKYNIKIWVGSGQFKEYYELGYENKNSKTLELLQQLKDNRVINELFTTDGNNNLLKDHEMRNKCIPWMKENDVDLMIQVDADEFYSTREANNLIQYIIDNPEHTIYNTTFKNVVGDGEIEDWSRFSAGWIKKNGGIRNYYFDCHWCFNDDIEYRSAGIKDIPKLLVNPYHYTWTNEANTTGPSHIKQKIEYQNKIYKDGCGLVWDDKYKTIKQKNKMKILFLAGHLSTGGMPQFLLKRIQSIKKYNPNIEIFVIEWENVSPTYVVQRNKIIDELKEGHFFSCGRVTDWSLKNIKINIENNQKKIVDFLYKNHIDILHVEGTAEYFITPEIQKDLYDSKHPWKVVETAHGINWDRKDKRYEPNSYAFVTNNHLKRYPDGNNTLIEYPIDTSIICSKLREEILDEFGYKNKGEFHIVNVGLWTPGKNQKYIIDIAKELYEKYGHTYIFHFIGNQAPNFKKYWEPLMEDLPDNILVWGERHKDFIDKFYKIADVMLFSSTWECNPVVLKEAISNNIKIIAFDLDHYGDDYIDFIEPLSGNLNNDINLVYNVIHNPKKYNWNNIKNLVNVEEFVTKHTKFYKTIIDKNLDN